MLKPTAMMASSHACKSHRNALLQCSGCQLRLKLDGVDEFLKRLPVLALFSSVRPSLTYIPTYLLSVQSEQLLAVLC